MRLDAPGLFHFQRGIEMTEKPHIVRGRLAFAMGPDLRLFNDNTATFTMSGIGAFGVTYHRAPVIGLGDDHVVVDITPSTVVTWDRLP